MTASPKLDRIDVKILAALQSEGRISNVDLAERVGLSQSPCLQRVKRLEKAGYIRRYEAVIDLARLGDFVTVFTEITLASHTLIGFSAANRMPTCPIPNASRTTVGGAVLDTSAPGTPIMATG